MYQWESEECMTGFILQAYPSTEYHFWQKFSLLQRPSSKENWAFPPPLFTVGEHVNSVLGKQISPTLECSEVEALLGDAGAFGAWLEMDCAMQWRAESHGCTATSSSPLLGVCFQGGPHPSKGGPRQDPGRRLTAWYVLISPAPQSCSFHKHV